MRARAAIPFLPALAGRMRYATPAPAGPIPVRSSPIRAVAAAAIASLALVAVSVPAAQAAPRVSADPSTAATVSASADETRTSSCIDKGKHPWSGRAVWGGEYRDGAGVKRIVNNFVGFTSPAADATTVDYSVKVYDGAGKLTSVQREDNRAFNFEDGSAYLSRNPSNPTSAPGTTRIVVSVGDGNDGYGNCTMTYVQPTPTVTPTGTQPGGPAAPGAPTDVVAAPDNGSVVMFFTPPKVTDGGRNALSAVTSYTATSSPGGLTGTGTASGGITVSGLTNGTPYTFTLTATNATGVGVASVASNSVTPNARITIAAPTNGTDAAPAIQAAISGAAPGRAVYLPAGTYTLTSVGVVGKAGVRFFGAGDTTIITGARNVYMPTNSSLDHMKLTCGTTNNVALTNYEARTTGVRVENSTFRGQTGQSFAIWLNGDGTNRSSRWTIRGNDFNNYRTALYFKPANSILLDQNTIGGASETQNTLWWGGSDNMVSNNTISGGITGVAFLHFRGTLKTYADRGVSLRNTVFRNTITNISEEGISFDVIGNLASNVAALDQGNIASKPGSNQITMSGGSWSTAGTTDYVGYYVCWMTGTNRGKTAKITAQSNGTMTLDGTHISYAGVSVGDRVSFGAPFMNNLVEQNSVTLKSGSGTHGILLYGLSYNNTIKNNFATGSATYGAAIRVAALAALLNSDINHSGNFGVAPTGYNTVDNNTTSGYDITADVLDFGSGNGYLNYGDSLTRNTITGSGAVQANYHVMATTGSVGEPGVAVLNTAPGGTVLAHQM